MKPLSYHVYLSGMWLKDDVNWTPRFGDAQTFWTAEEAARVGKEAIKGVQATIRVFALMH